MVRYRYASLPQILTHESTVHPRFNDTRFNVFLNLMIHFNDLVSPVFISMLNDPRFNDSFSRCNDNLDEFQITPFIITRIVRFFSPLLFIY